MNLKHLLHRTLHRFGYDLYRRDGRFHPEICARHLCKQKSLDVILDVGANTGQYVKALREWGYSGKVVSFEPLTSAHLKLSANAARDKNWEVAPRCAIGAAPSLSEINVAGNSVSSSLLEMLDSHRELAPKSTYVAKEQVKVETLDAMIHALCREQDQFYLKIDTQGYEREVLAGASETLKRIPAVQMELSVRPLYQSSLLLDEGIELMKGHGYRIHSVYQGFSDRVTGETLQVDVIFVR
jgi:FkbM family methyltransferase